MAEGFDLGRGSPQAQESFDPSVAGANALSSLRAEIETHTEHEQSRSYLGKAVDFIYRSDENSLQALMKLQQDIEQAQKQGNTSKADTLSKQAADLIKADRQSLDTHDEISHYAGGFIETTALFMRGKLGLAGTIAAYALDQMRPADDFRTQLVDGTLGGIKGGLLKGTFEFLGSKNVSVAAQGVALGSASRLLELGLSRQTYDAGNGRFDLLTGLGNTVRGTLDRRSLLSDAVVFGLAHGLLGTANSLSGSAIEKSSFLSTVLTSTTFGLSTGSIGEIMRQQAAGEQFDFNKILKRSLLQGALDTLAATPGGAQARAAALRQRALEAGLTPDSKGERPNLLRTSGLGPRHFLVLEGQDVIYALGAGKENTGWLKVREILSQSKTGSELGPAKSLFVQHLGKGETVNSEAEATADLLAFCNPEAASPLARSKHVLSEGKGPVWLTPDASTSRIAFTLGEQPLRSGSGYQMVASIRLNNAEGLKDRPGADQTLPTSASKEMGGSGNTAHHALSVDLDGRKLRSTDGVTWRYEQGEPFKGTVTVGQNGEVSICNGLDQHVISADKSRMVTDGLGAKRFYDSSGRFTKTVDTNGREFTFGYDSEGDLASVEGPEGKLYLKLRDGWVAVTQSGDHSDHIGATWTLNEDGSLTWTEGKERRTYRLDGIMEVSRRAPGRTSTDRAWSQGQFIGINPGAERAALERFANHLMPDSSQRAQFQRLMDECEAAASRKGAQGEPVAETFFNVRRLLQAQGEHALPDQARALLAEQLLQYAADPSAFPQGFVFTPEVNGEIKLKVYDRPQEALRAAADLNEQGIHSGSYQAELPVVLDSGSAAAGGPLSIMLEQWRDAVSTLAGPHLVPKEQRRLGKAMSDFESWAAESDLPPFMIAETYMQLRRMLEAPGDSPVPLAERARLAELILTAGIRRSGQGDNDFSHWLRQTQQDPLFAASLLADIATRGWHRELSYDDAGFVIRTVRPYDRKGGARYDIPLPESVIPARRVLRSQAELEGEADRRFPDTAERAKFQEMIDMLAQGGKRGAMPLQGAVDLVFSQVRDILQSRGGHALSNAERIQLAEQILQYAADPSSAGDGLVLSVKVKGLEQRFFCTDALDAAEKAADLSREGVIYDSSRKVLARPDAGAGVKSEFFNVAVLGEAVSGLVEPYLKKHKERKQFDDLMYAFEERGLPTSEIAETYFQLRRLLQGSGNSSTTLSERVQIAKWILERISSPASPITLATEPTRHLATVFAGNNNVYTLRPSEVAAYAARTFAGN